MAITAEREPRTWEANLPLAGYVLVSPYVGLYVVRVTYCCLRYTGRPVTEAEALRAAAALRECEGPNCSIEVLPAELAWREPERVEP